MMMKKAFREYWKQDFAAGGPAATRFFSQRIGAVSAWLAQSAGLAPSTVTLLGMACFVAGAVLFALLPSGACAALVCFAVLQLAYALDCADGQLARATGRSSAFGAWLDLTCDHVRNVVLTLGVVALLAMTHPWGLAAAAPAGAMLAAGTAVQLHTLATIRQAPAAASPRAGARRVLVNLIDTPVFLAALCLLRDLPHALAAAAIVYGTAYLGAGVMQAWRRLPRPAEA